MEKRAVQVTDHCTIESWQVCAFARDYCDIDIWPWQRQEVLDPMYEVGADGRRLRTHCLESTGRKNGKTTKAAIILLCHLCLPNAGVEQELAAVGGRNIRMSQIVLKEMDRIVRRRPFAAHRHKLQRFRGANAPGMQHRESGNRLTFYPADGAAMQGQIPNFVYMDEIAEFPDWEVYTALEQAVTSEHGAGGMVYCTSTMSTDPDSVLAQLLEMLRDLKRDHPEDYARWNICLRHGHIWTQKEVDAYNLEHGTRHSVKEMRMQWREVERANPALYLRDGFADQVRREWNLAKGGSPGAQRYYRIFAARRLNTPLVGGADELVDLACWHSSADPLMDIEDDFGKEVILAMDLSQRSDLTSLACYVVREQRAFVDSWLPSERLEENSRIDGEPYTQWADEGELFVSDGPNINYDDVLDRIYWYTECFRVRELRYDQTYMNTLLTKHDLRVQAGTAGALPPLVNIRQGSYTFGTLISEFRAIVTDRETQFRHCDNAVLNMAVTHSLVEDVPNSATDDKRFVKKGSVHRNDPAQALVMAVGIPPPSKVTGRKPATNINLIDL